MLILSNAKIYTLDPKQPLAEAMAIHPVPGNGGRIVALGSVEDINAEFGGKARIEEMGGRTILPGLTDAHIHFQKFALNLSAVDADTATQAECLQGVADQAKGITPGAWIRGHGWRQHDWPEGFGNAAQLDAVAPNHPVYLTAASLHAGWANSAALKAAGIDRNTPDPTNGQIQRDAAGEPSGVLFEEAMALMIAVIPKASHQDTMAAMRSAQESLWSMGLTGVHDFDRRASFEALQDLHSSGDLKLRVLKHLPVELLNEILALGLRSGFGDDMLRLGSIKVFADGALGPRTAAMLEPYEGEPENRGMLFVDAEELLDLAQRAARGGFGMTVHAIGDRANHEVLDAFEQLRIFEAVEGLPAYRHRIEHVQVLHPNDLGRLAALNVGASMQPLHATADMVAADKFWGGRARYGYAWKSQLEAGARLAFGSDAPVETPNPFAGLHAAVTRRRADGSPGEAGWYPSERLTFEEALMAYTGGPAYFAGMENRLGCLAAGYLADLIVLDRDPFETDADELAEMKATATMVGGEWVWRAD
ncbi:MAG: amidohydrolase [Chloroflexi bacterium]|nr:amidohydrolase [Chloroflexota bacterium]